MLTSMKTTYMKIYFVYAFIPEPDLEGFLCGLVFFFYSLISKNKNISGYKILWFIIEMKF